jgi:hypothetical protein
MDDWIHDRDMNVSSCRLTRSPGEVSWPFRLCAKQKGASMDGERRSRESHIKAASYAGQTEGQSSQMPA